MKLVILLFSVLATVIGKNQHQPEKRDIQLVSYKFKLFPFFNPSATDGSNRKVARDPSNKSIIKYVMLVFTSCESYAGTDSNNYAQLIGINTDGVAEFHEVSLQMDEDKTEKCGIDQYEFTNDKQTTYQPFAAYFFYNWIVTNNDMYTEIPHMGDMQKTNYRIWIYTRNKDKAGTDSNIELKICNPILLKSKECLDSIELNERSSGVNLFEKNELNGFQLYQFESIAEITYIRIKSDGAWSASDWLPGVIAINDDRAQVYYEFDGGGWIGGKDGWKQLKRIKHVTFELYTTIRKLKYEIRHIKFPFCNVERCGTPEVELCHVAKKNGELYACD